MVVVGWLGRGTTTLHCTHHALSRRLKVLSLFLLLSLPGPAVGEMLSATRYAAVGMVGRPLTHVVRDAFCEGSEGIAEVREQHRYPPTVSAVRERSGNVVGVRRSLTGDYADRDLKNPHKLPGSLHRGVLHPGVLQCGTSTSGTCLPQLKAVWEAVRPM